MATITARYQADANFATLLDTIGLDGRSVAHLINDGFNSALAFTNHFGGDIEGFEKYLVLTNRTYSAAADENIRFRFTQMDIAKLKGLLFYLTVTKIQRHTIVDIDNITNLDATGYGNAYRDFISLYDTENADDSNTITVPAFKGSKNWIAFRDSIRTKFGTIIGQHGFPLEYVVDTTIRAKTRANENCTEIAEVLNLDEFDLFTTETVHFGPNYKKDNAEVWTILKSHLLNTHGWDIISTFKRAKNGRHAWKALKAFYEGQDFTSRLQDEAFAMLSTTFYRGETRNFDFEKYTEIHLKAHKKLVEAGYNA